MWFYLFYKIYRSFILIYVYSIDVAEIDDNTSALKTELNIGRPFPLLTNSSEVMLTIKKSPFFLQI